MFPVPAPGSDRDDVGVDIAGVIDDFVRRAAIPDRGHDAAIRRRSNPIDRRLAPIGERRFERLTGVLGCGLEFGCFDDVEGMDRRLEPASQISRDGDGPFDAL